MRTVWSSLLQILWLVSLSQSDIDIFNVNVEQHDSTVVCYVTHWAKYRVEEGRFLANSFDPMLCTHLIYGYAIYNNITGEIESTDPGGDRNIEEGGRNGYAEYVGLRTKYKKLKVLLAIGGHDEGARKYSDVAGDVEKRKSFVIKMVAFLRKYKFDGLDFCWIWPGDVSRGGKLEDIRNFPILLEELNNAFRKADSSWILTISIASNKYIIDAAYDFPKITPFVQFINILALDYHGPWEGQTGFIAPLYHAKNRDHERNVQDTIRLLLERQVEPEKLVLGIPMYALTYTLKDPRLHKVGAFAIKPGSKGWISNNEGSLIFKEVCMELANPGRNTEWDEEQFVPYAYNNYTWITYEDERSVAEKVSFSLTQQLRGIMLYAIDMDDATAICQQVKMPLLRTVNKVFAEDYELRHNSDKIEIITTVSQATRHLISITPMVTSFCMWIIAREIRTILSIFEN